MNLALALLLLTKNSEPTIWLWFNQLAGNLFPGQFWEIKMLLKEQIEAVKVEMRRMAKAIGVMENNMKHPFTDKSVDHLSTSSSPKVKPYRSRYEAAVRRASMDLTRALADMRKAP